MSFHAVATPLKGFDYASTIATSTPIISTTRSKIKSKSKSKSKSKTKSKTKSKSKTKTKSKTSKSKSKTKLTSSKSTPVKPPIRFRPAPITRPSPVQFPPFPPSLQSNENDFNNIDFGGTFTNNNNENDFNFNNNNNTGDFSSIPSMYSVAFVLDIFLISISFFFLVVCLCIS